MLVFIDGRIVLFESLLEAHCHCLFFLEGFTTAFLLLSIAKLFFDALKHYKQCVCAVLIVTESNSSAWV